MTNEKKSMYVKFCPNGCIKKTQKTDIDKREECLFCGSNMISVTYHYNCGRYEICIDDNKDCHLEMNDMCAPIDTFIKLLTDILLEVRELHMSDDV